MTVYDRQPNMVANPVPSSGNTSFDAARSQRRRISDVQKDNPEIRPGVIDQCGGTQ